MAGSEQKGDSEMIGGSGAMCESVVVVVVVALVVIGGSGMMGG